MNWLAAYGLLAHGLIFGALATLLPIGFLRPRVGLAATTLALLVGIAPTLHGAFGPPSPTLLVLALHQLIAPDRPSPLSRRLALPLLITGSLFYALNFSSAPLDLHAIGFQPAPLLAALLPLGLALWWKRQYLWLAILSLDLLAYASGLFNNLWDTLFDPLLLVVALAILLRQQFQRLVSFIVTRRR